MKESIHYRVTEGELVLTFVDDDKKTVKEFTTTLERVALQVTRLFDKDGNEASVPFIVMSGIEPNNGARVFLEFKSLRVPKIKIL